MKNWFLYILIFIVVVGLSFYSGWSCHTPKSLGPQTVKDSLRIDTVTKFLPIIKYIKAEKVVSIDSVLVKDTVSRVYVDSLSDSTASGTYKIVHRLQVNPIKPDTALSNWAVAIHPIVQTVSKDVEKTIFQDVVSTEPFYKDVWFYVTAGLATLIVLLVK